MSNSEINVTDTRGLFIWSSVIDQVRDTTGAMSLSNEAVRVLIGQYNMAVGNVVETLSEEARNAISALSAELAETVDQTVLHASAASLAALLNAIHNGPAFVAQHQLAMTQIESHPDFDGFGESTADAEQQSKAPIGFAGAYL